MISIIIPVYNKEKYIKKCITSIQNQTYKDFECIIIDDGSTDDSSKIIFKLIKNDNRFKYIYQINSGVSVARNKGLELSTKPWICFIDADDYIEENYLQNFINSINENNCAMVICNPNKIQEYTSISNILQQFNQIYSYNIFNPPWGKLFKKRLIKTKFKANLSIGEDLLFNLSFMLDNYDQYIFFIDKNDYIYLDDIEDSLSRKVSQSTLEQMLQMINFLSQLTKIQTDEIIKIQSNSLFNKLLSYYISNKSLDWFSSECRDDIIDNVMKISTLRLRIALYFWSKKNYRILKSYLTLMYKLKGR